MHLPLDDWNEYYQAMKRDNRILRIMVNENLEALVFYSICDDPSPFYEKRPFEFLPHDISGQTVYIEMVIATRWLKKMRQFIAEKLLEKYPNLERAIWYRARKGDDQMIEIKRRNVYV